MTAKLVPTVRTTYTMQQLIQGFVLGWQKQFGVIPSKESVGVLYAQDTLETGSTVAMWNNNVGNVKYVPSANAADDVGKEYMMLANVWEIVNGQKVIFQPPSQATWFRAFETLADGIAFHLDFLKNHRYKAAWSAVESGNPAAFSHLLRLAGYYTAPEADYTRLMNTFFNKYMKDPTYDNVVAKLTAPATPVLTPIVPVTSVVVVAPPDVAMPTVTVIPSPALPTVPVVPVVVPAVVPAVKTKSMIQTFLDFIFPLLNLFKK